MRHTPHTVKRASRPYRPVLLLALATLPAVADEPKTAAPPKPPPAAPMKGPNNLPSMVDADGRLRLRFGEERLVLPRGLQPSLLCTRTGALVVQAQVPEKPYPSNRMTYFSAMST